jgi:hypothetical protein
MMCYSCFHSYAEFEKKIKVAQLRCCLSRTPRYAELQLEIFPFLYPITMVDSDSSDDESDEFCATFSLQLIRHTLAIPKIGKRPAIKSKRDLQSKELVFACLPDNYVHFMRAMLTRFGETKWKVSDQQRYKFKYYHPGRP